MVADPFTAVLVASLQVATLHAISALAAIEDQAIIVAHMVRFVAQSAAAEYQIRLAKERMGP